MLKFGSSIRNKEDKAKRVSIPIGAGLDVPSGRYVEGLKGESVLVAGLSYVTGLVGGPNTLKSTMMHYMVLTAVSRMFEAMVATIVDALDTEQTMIAERINELSSNIDHIDFVEMFENGNYTITDAIMMIADDWYESLRAWLIENKIKVKKRVMVTLPFKDLAGNPVTILAPTFGIIDSITEMQTKSGEKIENESDISDSKGNMLFARESLAKQKFLARLARICNEADHFVFITGHMGPKYQFDARPGTPPPTRDLPTMKADEKVKGAPNKFLYLPHNFYQTTGVGPHNNQATKLDEYPRLAKDDFNSSNDLMKIKLRCLRSKTGHDGYDINMAVSRSSGVVPEVTELDICKEGGNYGIERSGVGGSTYRLKIYPDVTFTRMTFREKCAEDPKLKRAINILSELCQFHTFHSSLDIFKTHGGIRDFDDFVKVIDEKFGWDKLLNTRGYWLINQYEHEKGYLSSLDLLRMYHGLYVPYWWKDEVKTPTKSEVKEVA